MFIDMPTPVRIWSGPFRFQLGPSGPDTAGGVYAGLGVLVDLPTLTMPINGASSQHTFSLSGLDARAAALINADEAAIRAAPVAIARLEMNADQTPNGDPVWLWWGVCDTPQMSRQGRSSPVRYTVALKASSGIVSRKRSQISLYTPSQQALRDPTDTSMAWVPTYEEGTLVTWPVF